MLTLYSDIKAEEKVVVGAEWWEKGLEEGE